MLFYLLMRFSNTSLNGYACEVVPHISPHLCVGFAALLLLRLHLPLIPARTDRCDARTG